MGTAVEGTPNKASLGVKAWAVAIVAIAGQTVAGALGNKITPAMASLLEFFNQTTIFGSTLSSIMAFTLAVLTVPLGALCLKSSPKVIAIVGAGLMAAASIIGTFVGNNVAAFLAIRFVEAVGYATMFVVSQVFIVRWFPAEKRGLPMGILAASIGIGQVICYNAATFVMGPNHDYWQGLWYFMSFLCLIVFVAFIVFVKDWPDKTVQQENAEATDKNQSGGRQKTKVEWKKINAMPVVLGVAFIYLAFAVGAKGYSPFSNLIYTQQAGATAVEANMISSFNSFCNIFGSILGGWAFAKAGRYRGMVFLVITLLTFASYFVGFSANSVPMAWIVAGLSGFFPSAIVPCCFQMAPEHSPTQALAPLAAAVMVFGKSLGAVIGPYIIAIFKDATGEWYTIRWMMACFFVICGIICWFIYRADKNIFWRGPKKATYEEAYKIKEESAAARKTKNVS